MNQDFLVSVRTGGGTRPTCEPVALCKSRDRERTVYWRRIGDRNSRGRRAEILGRAPCEAGRRGRSAPKRRSNARATAFSD